MSGNPFRAAQTQKSTAGTPVPTLSFIGANDSRAEDAGLGIDSVHTSPLPSSKTKKSVRIESPTSSPPHPAFHDSEPLSQRVHAQHAGSPPPSSPAGFSDNFEDQSVDQGLQANAYASTASNKQSWDLPAVAGDYDDSSDEQELITDTRTSTGMAEQAATATQVPPGAPANPFSKTLATIEPQKKGFAEQRDTSERAAAEKTMGNSKPNLDVEGFKNLLMRGISSPTGSNTPPSHPTAAPNPIHGNFESSNSTDTSSISRQSLFEPVQEPHPETPRTSHEMARSDDEEVGLVSERKPEKKKPPPPKHRHGKLVTSRTPQTVSFSDFSTSAVPQATQPTSSPISRTRTNSDLNKALPAPPSVTSPPAHIASQISQDRLPEQPFLHSNTSESSNLSDASAMQKKMPPPVPLARRQSQLRSSTSGNRSRSNSSLTMSSQHSTEFPLLSPGPSSDPTSSPYHQKAAPPPPPSRRHGAALANANPSSADSSTTELPTTSSARRATVSSTNTPTPPSSRRPTISSPPASSPSPALGLARTTSTSSSRNMRSISNESATSISGMPPPPPPPRRRQSGRRSMDRERPSHASPTSPTESRRTSLENKRSSFDHNRRTSVASESSLRHEYAPQAENEHALYSPRDEIKEEPAFAEAEAGVESAAVLDEMERFQKEVDELLKSRSSS